MNPIIPEESEIRKEVGNQIPGVEEEEGLTTLIDSIMSPLIVDRDHRESEDEFESADYGEGTINCVLPLHPEDSKRRSVTYLDDKLGSVEPTLMIRATGALSDLVIVPLGFTYPMAMTMMCSAHYKITSTWRRLPQDIRQWCKWLIVSMLLGMIMAAIGIHAWDDSKPTNAGAEVVPDVEWYARDDEYFDRRIDEHRTTNVSCIARGLTPYSQIHT